MQRLFKIMSGILAWCVAVSGLGLAIVIEVINITPLSWQTYAGFGLLVLLLQSIPLALGGSKSKLKLVSLILFVVCLSVLYFMPWSTRKPFLRDLNRIKVGMSETQAENIMGGYMRGTGLCVDLAVETPPDTIRDFVSGRAFPTKIRPNGEVLLANAMVFRHSNDGRFNADWGVIRLKRGRVVAVHFLPD